MTLNIEEALPRVTKRIILRRLTVFDLDSFQAYRRDPEVARYQGWQTMTDAEAIAFLTEMNAALPLQSGQWYQLGIARRSDNALIGDIGICVASSSDQAEIGFTLSRNSQRKGLGSEAVREAIAFVWECSEVAQLVGITDARNLSSIRLLERVGMRQRESIATEFQGEPCVEHVFTLSRHDLSEQD